MRMSALTKVEMSSCVDSFSSLGGQHGQRGDGVDVCEGVAADACDPESDGQGPVTAGGQRDAGGHDAPVAAADPAGPG